MADRANASPMARFNVNPGAPANRLSATRAFPSEVDTGSREGNASNQESSASERVPGRARRIFEIADIGAEPQPDAGADRHQHDVVGGERGHAEAADDVGRAVDADEALIDRLRRGQVVDQRHGARTVAAPVEAD